MTDVLGSAGILKHVPSTYSTVLGRERRLKDHTVAFAFMYMVTAGFAYQQVKKV